MSVAQTRLIPKKTVLLSEMLNVLTNAFFESTLRAASLADKSKQLMIWFSFILIGYVFLHSSCQCQLVVRQAVETTAIPQKSI